MRERRPPVRGYSDRPSARPGESVAISLSAPGREVDCEVRLQRLEGTDLFPEVRPITVADVEGVAPQRVRVRRQMTAVGSFGVVGDDPALAIPGSFTVAVRLNCTRSPDRLAGAVTRRNAGGAGFCLGVDAGGRVLFEVGDGGERVRVRCPQPLVRGNWYDAVAAFDAGAGCVRLDVAPAGGLEANRVDWRAAAAGAWSGAEATTVRPAPAGDLLLAATGVAGRAVEGAFDGKLEAPVLLAGVASRADAEAVRAGEGRPGLVAAWDFARELSRDGVRPHARVTDTGPHELHGVLHNWPLRGVTGSRWDGSRHHYADAPAQYAAIHFHSDDVADSGWEPGARLDLPPELPSGVYVAAVHGEGREQDLVPFFVRKAVHARAAPVAVLVPTVSYLAYGNTKLLSTTSVGETTNGRVLPMTPEDFERMEDPAFGASLYDRHPDGTGFAYASWRRPLLTLRVRRSHAGPKVRQFETDLALLEWFRVRDLDVDLVTDHDLHAEGAAALSPYRVVVTGCHPEYHTAAMLDGIADYVGGGGRFFYTGGNGFYWVSAISPEAADVMEIRRWGGSQAWEAAPGECYLSTTGELGGTWRGRGRAPQKLVGVGFVAQGIDSSTYFRRLPASRDPEFAWVFEGLDAETFGDHGRVGDGAAGWEIDCYDPALGSADDAVVLATSECSSRLMLEVKENMPFSMPFVGGADNDRVRADLTYTRFGRGEVLSTGSIAWSASLLTAGGDNDVSHVMENVVRHLSRPLTD